MNSHNWHRIAVTGLVIMIVGLLAWGVSILGLSSSLDDRDAHPSLLVSAITSGGGFVSAIAMHRKNRSDGYLWIMLLISGLLLLMTAILAVIT